MPHRPSRRQVCETPATYPHIHGGSADAWRCGLAATRRTHASAKFRTWRALQRHAPPLPHLSSRASRTRHGRSPAARCSGARRWRCRWSRRSASCRAGPGTGRHGAPAARRGWTPRSTWAAPGHKHERRTRDRLLLAAHFRQRRSAGRLLLAACWCPPPSARRLLGADCC